MHISIFIFFELILTFQEEYFSNRKLSKLGSTIASGVAASQTMIPEDQALYFQKYCHLGKVGYTALRLSLLPYGTVLPTYDAAAKYKYDNIIPLQMVIN